MVEDNRGKEEGGKINEVKIELQGDSNEQTKGEERREKRLQEH